jgi:uncharacterized GH25 family protein
MRKNKAIASVLYCLVLCLLTGSAWAHDLWITCPKAKAGKKLLMDISYGHEFPKGDKLNPDELEETYVMGAVGKINTAPNADKNYLTAKPLSAGSYLAVSGTKAKFYTKTNDGYVRKPKNEVKNPEKCFRSIKYAKAIVNLGKRAGDVSHPLGQDLELVPLANPATLQTGTMLPVKVLLAGKPLVGAEVTGATAAQFAKGAMGFVATTNAKGVAQIKLSEAGLWLIRINHKTPYKDPAKCDVLSKTAVLTFEME